MDTVNEEMQIILDKNLCFGAKIVRGAYMEKERKRAKEMGYPDPVNDNYDATGKMYDSVINHLIQDLLAKSSKNHHLVVATHNEKGLFNAIGTMMENGMENNNEKVVFGQIYGMGEQLSMPLGNNSDFFDDDNIYNDIIEVVFCCSQRWIFSVQVRALRSTT